MGAWTWNSKWQNLECCLDFTNAEKYQHSVSRLPKRMKKKTPRSEMIFMHTTYSSVISKKPDYRVTRKVGMHLGAFCRQGENGKKTPVVIIAMATFFLSFNSWEFLIFQTNKRRNSTGVIPQSIYRFPVLCLCSSKNNWGFSYTGKSFSEIPKERASPRMASAKIGSIVAADNLDLCISVCKLGILKKEGLFSERRLNWECLSY